MRGQDPNAMALLPVLGLSACVASTGMDASTSPDQLRASAQEPTWIEPAVERDPMTLLEAAVVASETSLAAGEFEAARELLSVARELDPESTQLRLAQVDALIGMREYAAARQQLVDLRYVVDAAQEAGVAAISCGNGMAAHDERVGDVACHAADQACRHLGAIHREGNGAGR